MNVVIYTRFSSSSQREESIEGQIKICEAYAKQHGLRIVDTYCDRAISGKSDDRPDFQRLIADSAKRHFQAVLVYSVDRFGRNLHQSIENEVKLKKNGVELISATENFGDNPAGRMQRNIMMTFAQYYSDELAQKIKRGMDLNAEKCLCTGGNIALGFKVDADKKFQVDSETALIVQRVFELYVSGKTVKEITDYLNEQGAVTSRGVPFNKNSLRIMLQNKRYIGTYTYKGNEIPNGMPRIISDELFYKAAEIMHKNKKAPARKRAKAEYLLTTKLFCGHCKEMMTGFSGTGKAGKVYNYYICNKVKLKACNKKTVNKVYIEDLVIDECQKLLTDERITHIAEAVVGVNEQEKDNTNLRRLNKLLAEHQRKLKNLMSAIMDCDIDSVRKTFYAEIPKIEKAITETEKEIALEKAVKPAMTVSEVKFFLKGLKNGDINNLHYRRSLITIFVNKIYLYDDKVTFFFNTGTATTTVDVNLLSEIERNNREFECSFMNTVAPPLTKPRNYGESTVIARFFYAFQKSKLTLKL